MSDDQKPADHPTPPQAAADKAPSDAPAEPLKGEVSRTDAPGAGASAAPEGTPKEGPPAPKPENPSAATTATTAETSSALGQPTAPADETVRPAAKTAAASVAPKPAEKPEAKPEAKAGAGAAAKPAPKAAEPKAAAPTGPPDPPPPADVPPPGYIVALQQAIAGSVEQLSFWVGDWTIVTTPVRLIEVATFLRDEPVAAFDFCSDVTAADWPPRAQRFDVVYCLYSTRHRHRVRVKVRAGEGEAVPSVTRIWPAANWLEREVYDLFGVNFVGHPDRRRILMPDEWQGHPQRKDYPLEGPGELLMENPLDWLKLRTARDEAEIE